jgi:PRTRC genetic system protein F
MIGYPQLGAMALPHLAPSIPLELHIPGENALAVPLAIALLEAGVITDAMLRPGPNATLVEVLGEPDEREMSMVALSRWWAGLIKRHSCAFFRWHLHVQQLIGTGHNYDDATTAWFCFTRYSRGGLIPRFSLARRTEQLEAVLEGFGQTVLAVLYDATLLLPDSLNPWLAQDLVQWLHWDDSETDEELLENHRNMNGYATVQEVLDNDVVITRAAFYADMPRWVTRPERVASREQIVRAAREGFGKSVVAACDAIAELVNRPDFVLRSEDKGVHRCGLDSVDGSMVLLWKENDAIGQVIDEALNMFGESGEYSEFIDANPVPMTAEGVRDFQLKTRQMMQLAVLTEKLVLLIGDPI